MISFTFILVEIWKLMCDFVKNAFKNIGGLMKSIILGIWQQEKLPNQNLCE